MAGMKIICCLILALLPNLHAEHDFNFNDSQFQMLEPKEEPTHTMYLRQEDPYVTEMSRCKYTDNEILLSLVLKRQDWYDLSDTRRAKVLDKLSHFFAIPKEFIVLETVTKRDLNEMYKEAIRKGGNNLQSNYRRLGRVNLMLGCGATYFSMGEPIVNQIGHQMKDKSIDNITGEKFGWWVIWRKHYKNRSERDRRQVESSGENDEDEYEYDDDPIDGETEIPNVATSSSVSTSSTTTAAPSSTTKEIITSVQPTPTHAHRHHHGQKSEFLANDMKEVHQKNNYNIDKDGIDIKTNTAKSMDKNNIDEEIVESVSQLESVITKTIENTQNINELPVESDQVQLSVVESSVDIDSSEPIAAEDVGDSEVMDKTLTYSAVDVETSINVTMPAVQSSSNGIMIDAVTQPSMQLPMNHYNLAQLPDGGRFVNQLTSGEVLETMKSINVPQNSTNSTVKLPQTVTTALVDITESTTLVYTNTTAAAATTITPTNLSINNITTTTTTIDIPIKTTTTTTPVSLSASNDTTAISSFATTDFIISTVQSTTNTSSTATMRITANTTTSFNISRSSASLDLAKDEETTLPTEREENNIGSTIAQQNVESTEAATPMTSTQATTSTTSTVSPISTDFVEPIVENVPPMIKTRLQKFAVTSGKLFSYIVPEETFFDQEDNTNLRLQLSEKEGQELSANSWLQFNAETHEIYGLPLDDAVSRWQYLLSATDSGNETVTETLEMTVQQHRGVRSVNHELSIIVKLLERPVRNIDWQLKLVKAIAQTLSDNGTNAIVVREVRQTANDPNTAIFAYFNESLPTTVCPEAELIKLTKDLQQPLLQELVEPTLIIKQVTGQLIGACHKPQLPARPKPTSTMIKNVPPQPRNQVDRVNATAGHLLVYKVPSDTFYDDHELTLSLRTKDNKELLPRHWLQFDSKNQEFYGIPKSIDIGTEEYLLVAENSLGLIANDALVVVVNSPIKRDYLVSFKAYLGIRHEQFNADLQRKFVERLAGLFGDSGTQYIQIRSVNTQHEADSTVVNFYNTTLIKTHHRCPEQQVEAARSVFLMPDNSVRERVKQILGPELNLTNMQIQKLASCHAQMDISQREYPTAKAEVPSQSAFGENYMITIVYPAIIIITMILIACLIACCVHKRRRKSGKMELGDEEERKSFRTKGIPVIFQDELDEKPEIGNKSPIILKDEKPPLLPPSYNTSNMNGDNDVDEYVPPPAVVVGGREVRGKSPATPSYRKPPPYVSP